MGMRCTVVMFVLAGWLVGCATPQVANLTQQLETVPECCRSLQQITFEPLPANLSFDMAEVRQARKFSTGKSLFRAFELPPLEQPTSLQIQSWLTGSTVASSHLFYPLILTLDANHRPVREYYPEQAWSKDPLKGDFLDFYLTLIPQERYLILYTNRSVIGRTIEYRYQDAGGMMAIPGVNGTTMFVNTPSSETTTSIPFAAAGKVSLNLQAAPSEARSKDYLGTNVPYLNFEIIETPPIVEGFGITDSTTFSEPALGHRWSYQSAQYPQVSATLFVYPMIQPGHVSRAELLDHELAKVLKEIQQMHKQGGYDVFEQKSLKRMSAAEQPVLMADLVLGKQGQRLTSRLYVMPLNETFVKLRLTYPVVPELAWQVDDWALQLLQSVVVPAWHGVTLSPDKLSMVYTRSTVALAESRPAAAIPFLAYGQALIRDMEKNGVYGEFDREYLAHQAMIDSWRKLKARTDELDEGKTAEEIAAEVPLANSYLDLLERLEDDGWLREYLWHYRRRSYWQRPADLSLTAFEHWRQEQLQEHQSPGSYGIIIRP